MANNQRSDKPRDVWTKKGPTLNFGRERFRVWWIPVTGKMKGIEDYVERVTWDDVTAVLTGEIQLRDPATGAGITIGIGDEIKLDCALTGSGNFTEIWRMRVPQPNRDFESATRTFQLTNALGWLARSTDSFSYVVNKKHKKGWLASEIVRDIAKRYGIKIGVIAQTKHRIKKLVATQASPLDVIAAAYKRERNYTGRRFVMSCDHGKLNIRSLVRSASLLQLGPDLIQASFQEQLREDFATAVTVRVPGKKITVKVTSAAAVKRFGHVHRDVWAHGASSRAAAKAAAKRHLTLVGKPTKQLALSHPGIPTIRRGDALRVALPEPALKQVLFITEAHHEVTPGDYQMQLQIGFTDPYVAPKADSVDELKDKNAKDRGRKTKKKSTKAKAKAKGAKQRGDKSTPGERLSGKGHG